MSGSRHPLYSGCIGFLTLLGRSAGGAVRMALCVWDSWSCCRVDAGRTAARLARSGSCWTRTVLQWLRKAPNRKAMSAIAGHLTCPQRVSLTPCAPGAQTGARSSAPA